MSEYLSVNTKIKDGDPRKTAFTVGLMHRHRDAVSIYQDFGLMRKIPISTLEEADADRSWGHSVRSHDDAWERRMHFASEHMVTVIAGVQALGQLLVEHGMLSEQEVFEVEQAAAVHDAGKELEFRLVGTALTQSPSKSDYVGVLQDLPGMPEQRQLDERIKQYMPSMLSDEKGVRGLSACDLAGEVNELRLKQKGVSDKVVQIQKMVGHASCPEIEEVVNSFDPLKGSRKKEALQMLVMHYIDDIVTNPNIIDPAVTSDEEGDLLNALDRRCIQNEKNPKYREYNSAWVHDSRNTTGETAFEMQRRVGHRVEHVLAKVLGVEDPLQLPALIDARIQENITQEGQDTEIIE